MADLEDVTYREAGPSDAPAIATLHADSWRRHYRGAYSDDFLDGDVTSDRLAVWTERMNERAGRRSTIVAESAGTLVGFSHVVFDDDETWGALLENLHVTYVSKGRGIGTRLMAATARVVVARERPTGLYLWVLEQNTAARAFYEARQGVCVERRPTPPPGGDPARLNGTPTRLRFTWPDPAVLLPPS